MVNLMALSSHNICSPELHYMHIHFRLNATLITINLLVSGKVKTVTRFGCTRPSSGNWKPSKIVTFRFHCNQDGCFHMLKPSKVSILVIYPSI
jgi:hypothetical protein